MSKRPSVNLSALTAEAAAPMTEASQRVARPAPVASEAPAAPAEAEAGTKTENLQALAFKVSPHFVSASTSAPPMPISTQRTSVRGARRLGREEGPQKVEFPFYRILSFMLSFRRAGVRIHPSPSSRGENRPAPAPR